MAHMMIATTSTTANVCAPFGCTRTNHVRVMAAAAPGMNTRVRAMPATFLRKSSFGAGSVRGASMVAHAKKKVVEVEKEEEDEYEEVEVEEIVEEVVEVSEDATPVQRPMQGTMQTIQEVAPGLWDKPIVRNSAYTVGVVLAGTFLWSCFQIGKKYLSKRSKRKRNVGKNMLVIESLNEYLPAARAKLDKGAVGTIKRVTGFKVEEIFRKYLRYLLDQRQFDQDAVLDMVQLKNSAGLSNETVVEMFEESAKRTFERTGILMRKPSGMTASGLQKKATGRALFAKLMYLADQDALLPGAMGEKLQMRMMEIFGATEEDFQKLRITTLNDQDTDRLEKLMGRGLEGGASDEVEESMDETECADPEAAAGTA